MESGPAGTHVRAGTCRAKHKPAEGYCAGRASFQPPAHRVLEAEASRGNELLARVAGEHRLRRDSTRATGPKAGTAREARRGGAPAHAAPRLRVDGGMRLVRMLDAAGLGEYLPAFVTAAAFPTPGGRPPPPPGACDATAPPQPGHERPTSPWFFLAAALPGSLESPPVERVLLLRDEMANLAWRSRRTSATTLARSSIASTIAPWSTRRRR
jgi:hypothetical protein